jgi:hypothetical protein
MGVVVFSELDEMRYRIALLIRDNISLGTVGKVVLSLSLPCTAQAHRYVG